MPAVPGEAEWEKIVRRKIEEKLGPSPGKAKPSQHPVRLSDLRPPAGPSESAPSPGRGATAAGGRAAEEGEPPGAVELRARLEESEKARRAAEARVACLVQEIANLRAGPAPGGGLSPGSGAGPTAGEPASEEIERLRRELADAHAVIRSIEEAFLAGERGEADRAPGR